jgi:hypothetical protein
VFKNNGFDKLTKQLSQAADALSRIDGEIGTVSFDPKDPLSIEQAIKNVEIMIDAQLGDCGTNPIIRQIIDGMKEQYRTGILERAATARIEDDK